MNQRVSLVAAALFAIAILAIFALHRRSQRFPCPVQGGEAARQILLEDIHVVAVDRNIVTVNAFAKNNSPRALRGLIVETTATDGKRLVTEARNNERGAPSLADAPILPGASRAIRLQFTSASPQLPKLRVFSCTCE